MPRNASGTVTLPTNDSHPAAPRNVIRSSDFNEIMGDITTELTDSWSRSGKGAALANLDMGGFSLLNPGNLPTNSRSINTGTGLTGGGNLSADRTIALNGASIASLAKADTALQPAPNFVSRAGNYFGIGQQADFDGFGKGGVLLGEGHTGRGTGTFITLDGLRNWVAVQSSEPYNPTEWIIYGSSAQGYAQTVAGGGNITKLYGNDFSSDFVGKAFYFLRKKFKVSAVASATSLTLTETDGSPVVFPGVEVEAFNFNFTTGDGVCNIVGDRVHWVSGDPFVPLFMRDFHLIVNGVERTVAEFISAKEYRLSSSPGDLSNVAFNWYGDINDQLSTLRVQAIAGTEEENVNLYAIAGDTLYGRYYALTAGASGTYAKTRPLNIGAGFFGPYQLRFQFSSVPEDAAAGHNGYAEIGGASGLGALRVYCPSTMSTSRNYLAMYPVASGGGVPGIQAEGVDTNVDAFITGKGSGGVRVGNHLANYLKIVGAGAGFDPAIRAQGSDTNRGLGLDMKGSGSLSVTQDFARTLLQVRGAGSTVNFVGIDAGAAGTGPAINAEGSDTNIDLRLFAKGTGRLRYGTFVASGDVPIVGSIEWKDSGGTVRKVAIVA